MTSITNIAHKAIVLKLNKLWKPVQVALVSDTICDLMKGIILAMDINYALNEDGSPNFDQHEYVEAVDWAKWITLPVRSWDLSIHSSRMEIRVPTVVITKKYSKVHEKKFKGKPTKEALFIRDNGIDGYTGNEIAFEDATKDHVIPLSRGGTDTYDNVVLTTKATNNSKGNRLNEEIGLPLFINPHNPKPIKISHTIKRSRHPDWNNFLVKQ